MKNLPMLPMFSMVSNSSMANESFDCYSNIHRLISQLDLMNVILSMLMSYSYHRNRDLSRWNFQELDMLLLMNDDFVVVTMQSMKMQFDINVDWTHIHRTSPRPTNELNQPQPNRTVNAFVSV